MPRPKFNIGQTVYSKISATKGYVEPLYIHSAYYNPYKNTYIYSFRRSLRGPPQLLPVRLSEMQIITFYEAVDIQIGVLQKEYNKAVKTLQERCPEVNPIPALPVVPRLSEDPNTLQTVMPKPKYGYNQVVYLRESAEASGSLEAMRITDISWENKHRQWLYSFEIQPRPEYNMPVGDADVWRRRMCPSYSETELLTMCEAQQLAVNFLASALAKAKSREYNLVYDDVVDVIYTDAGIAVVS